MNNIYILDFDDSFTFNITNRLYQMNLTAEIVPLEDHIKILKKISKIKDQKICLILGAGPGHPDHYDFLNEGLNELMQQQNVLLFGICLGHQILMKRLGFKIFKKRPLHGVPFVMRYKKQSVLVQQYNSLAVKYKRAPSIKGKILHQNGVLLGMESERLVSWQFHPESVGTSCPLMFFSSVPNFLYNSRDGSKTQNQDRRHILARHT